MINRFKKQDAFSIVEVMVSFTIITVALLGISSLVILNLQARVVKKHILVASMLSQEGIELVRNIRDENMVINADAFDTDINQPSGSFIIDYNGRSSIDESVNSIDASSARLHDDGSFYSYATGNATPYYRIINMWTDAANTFIAASSTVKWQDNFGEHTYITETLLYDWL